MYCPRCQSESDGGGRTCLRCGYTSSGKLRTPVLSATRLTAFSSEQKSFEPLINSSTPSIIKPLGTNTLLKIGRYYLTKEIVLPESQQPQGIAWFAIDSAQNNRRVVLREIDLSSASGYLMQSGLLNVNFIARRLSNLAQYPGIPQVLDVFTEEKRSFIVLEYIEGVSLAALLKQSGGALPEREVIMYGRQLCEILTFFSHQQPAYVHGAISPDTIVVSPDRKQVSLIMAPLFLPGERPYIKKSTLHPGYAAPEQRNSVAVPESDLFSLAAVLHHAVTGYPPQERLNFFYPPARRLNPRVSQRMEEILCHELRLSISHRYAQPADMQAEFSSLLTTLPHVEPLDPLPTFTRRGTVRSGFSRLNIALMILSAALIIVCTLSLLAFSRVIAQSPGAQQQAAMNAELALEQQAFKQQGIGISDGRFVFDTYAGRSDVALKQQAGQAIQQGNYSQAINLLTQAVTVDPTDGEAQIYNEDLHILQSNAPYVTIVLGRDIDKSPAHVIAARAALEAAYLAQIDANTQNVLPDGLKLRLLIDNSGAQNSNVATAAQFIVNRVIKAGNSDHIVGVVGWPTSTQTIDARDIIASAHIPLVSQTASAVELSGSSSYFFRVNPADDEQGTTLGTLGATLARTILVLRDSDDPYSVSLANAFTKQVEQHSVGTIQASFSEGTTTVQQYETIINNAVQSSAGLIFLPGSDVDAVRLAYSLGLVIQQHPDDSQLANFQILCSDAAASALILGQGTGPDRDLAANNPQDMRHLLFTAFADPDESSLLGLPKPAFFSAWTTVYQSSAVQADNASSPTQAAILNYDAVSVIVSAIVQTHTLTPTGQRVRNALVMLGHGNVPAYQGVSGKVSFNAQGNPIDKALVVLDVEAGANGANVFHLKRIVGIYQ